MGILNNAQTTINLVFLNACKRHQPCIHFSSYRTPSMPTSKQSKPHHNHATDAIGQPSINPPKSFPNPDQPFSRLHKCSTASYPHHRQRRPSSRAERRDFACVPAPRLRRLTRSRLLVQQQASIAQERLQPRFPALAHLRLSLDLKWKGYVNAQM